MLNALGPLDTAGRVPSSPPNSTLLKGSKMRREEEWNPDKIRAVLDMELNPVRTESGELVTKTPEQLAVERLKSNAAFAAEVLIDTMWNSDNDSLRMKAANEVLNRVYGRTGDMPMSSGMGGIDSELGKLLDGVVSSDGS